MFLIDVLLPLIAVSSCLSIALLAGSRLLRRSPSAAWLAASVCLVHALFTWGFQLLGLLHWFSRVFIVPIFVLAPLILVSVCRKEIAIALNTLRTAAAQERAALAGAFRLHPWVGLALSAIAIHVVIRLARTLATPAFGWDDFTYHLFRAGRWVQSGGITLEPAPDAWSYYEFFSWGGDLIWAWSLVWGAGDVLVPFAAVGIWIACLLLAYGLARRCECEPLSSLIVAVALTVLPSQVTQISTAYVDNVQLMLVLATAVLLLEYLQFGRTHVAKRDLIGAAFVLGVGGGLGTLVKLSFLPLLGLTSLTVAWASIRRRRLAEASAFLLGTTILIPNLAFNWYHRGSPFYPFRVIEFLPFNAQLSQVLSQLAPADIWHRVPMALTALVLNARAGDPFLNMGFAGVLLLILGGAGAIQLWQQPSARAYLICFVISGVVTITQLVSPSYASMLTTWAAVLARFVVPSLAAIMVLSARLPVVVRTVLLPVVVIEYFVYAPWQWPRQLLLATAAVLVTFIVMAIAAIVTERLRVRPALRWAVLMVIVVLSLSATRAVHDRVRYGSYSSFASRQLDDFHGARRIGTWPIWLRLDERGPGRVAMAAGWDGIGHNWFRYGLLGARLDHDVRYVPVTADGSIVNYADSAHLAAVADREAWLRRLEQMRIDWVVALGPRTFEHEWLEGLPDVFSVELAPENHAWILARVNRQTLASHVHSAR